jgi:hypothetical protein
VAYKDPSGERVFLIKDPAAVEEAVGVWGGGW